MSQLPPSLCPPLPQASQSSIVTYKRFYVDVRKLDFVTDQVRGSVTPSTCAPRLTCLHLSPPPNLALLACTCPPSPPHHPKLGSHAHACSSPRTHPSPT